MVEQQLIFGIGQAEPIAVDVKRDAGNERRHDDQGDALPRTGLEALVAQRGALGRPADELIAEDHRHVARRRRRLEAGIETPAEHVGAVSEADLRAVQRDRRIIGFETSDELIELPQAHVARGERHRGGDLHFPPHAQRIGDVLVVRLRIESEDADGPMGQDVIVEYLSGLGPGVRRVVVVLHINRQRDVLRRGHVLDVIGQAVVEQGGIDEQRPGELRPWHRATDHRYV